MTSEIFSSTTCSTRVRRVAALHPGTSIPDNSQCPLFPRWASRYRQWKNGKQEKKLLHFGFKELVEKPDLYPVFEIVDVGAVDGDWVEIHWDIPLMCLNVRVAVFQQFHNFST